MPLRYELPSRRGSKRPGAFKIANHSASAASLNVVKTGQRVFSGEKQFINDEDDMIPRPLQIRKRPVGYHPLKGLNTLRGSALGKENQLLTPQIPVDATKTLATVELSLRSKRGGPSGYPYSPDNLCYIDGPNISHTFDHTESDSDWGPKVPPTRADFRHNLWDPIESAQRANTAAPTSIPPTAQHSAPHALGKDGHRSRALSTPLAENRHHVAASAQIVSRARARSATTNVVSSHHSPLIPNRKASVASEGSQPLKRRLLSRAMDALTISTSIPQVSLKAGRLRTGISSSAGDRQTVHSDLHDPLRAPPRPPTAGSTSATSIIMPVRKSYDIRSPPAIAVAGIQLEMIADPIGMSCESGQRISVAVQIKGEAYQTSPIGSLLAPRRLDVAVVIDNSLFTSPATLLAQCETTRFLASLLDHHRDRLALFCSRPLQAGTCEPNTVAPLSSSTIRAVKSVTDTIFSFADKPEPAALAMALDSAIDVLMHAAPNSNGDQVWYETFGHVFILTPNGYGLSSDLLNHQNLQIHIIESGVLGWKNPGPAISNGWTLRPSCPDRLPWVTDQIETDAENLFARLRTLMSFARSGSVWGRVADLSIRIEPGRNCSIDSLMGQCRHSFVQPGEVITVWANVKIGSDFDIMSPNHSDGSRAPTSDDLLKELDFMLGSGSEPVLLAKVSYKHSLLPLGTSCELSESAAVRRQCIQPQLMSTSDRLQLLQGNKNRLRVQKTLVHHLARNSNPREALTNLRGRFGEAGEHSICPEYFKLMTSELAYQARIMERFSLPSQSYDNSNAFMKSADHMRTVHGDDSNGSRRARAHNTSHWVTKAHGSEARRLALPSDMGNASSPYIQPSHLSEPSRSVGDLIYSRSKDSIGYPSRVPSDQRKSRRPKGIRN